MKIPITILFLTLSGYANAQIDQWVSCEYRNGKQHLTTFELINENHILRVGSPFDTTLYKVSSFENNTAVLVDKKIMEIQFYEAGNFIVMYYTSGRTADFRKCTLVHDPKNGSGDSSDN